MQTTKFKTWYVLFGLQLFIALILFAKFLSGQFYYAYVDIGSDSYGQVTPYAMHMARTFAREGFTGWSFASGLGGATAMWLGDLFGLLSQVRGPDNVLPLRIWVYVLKIILGGAAFLLLVRCYVTRWQTAVISALAYSYCGYMVVNGQWDSEGTVFIFFPLILWAIAAHIKRGGLVALPIVIASSLVCGVFFVALGVFLILTLVAYLAASDKPQELVRVWLFRIFPLVAVGYLLAAPILLPIILQLLDSSRVGGDQSLFQKIVAQSLTINDPFLIFSEIGGFFHKDIFGIGSSYRGFFNYLEGPGFYIGILLFLIIPQLWGGTGTDRRVLLIAIAAIVVYLIFPVLRFTAMGFAAPYFRVSTLWITLILMMLSAKALDRVLKYGLNLRLLMTGLGIYALLLTTLLLGSKEGVVWMPHVCKIIGLTTLAMAVLLLAYKKVLTERLLPLALLGVVVIEILMIALPSYFDGRIPVRSDQNLYNDGTLEALKDIRDIDNGVFRIEKTYHSVSLDDALAQDYLGVKSYYFHGRGVVDFYIGLGLIPPPQTANGVNYTNWLPNMGDRFMLNSLLGVKYIIAREALQWPGYIKVGEGQNYQIYRNELALPLGIVQTKQITQETFSKLSTLPQGLANDYRDIVMMNAVVVKDLMPANGQPFDFDKLVSSKRVSFDDRYIKPATDLQATGLKIKTFASNHIMGTISPGQDGILVFSIPFNQGWSLMMDGVATPMIRANFGMLAAPVSAGTHAVELRFQLPGQQIGFWLGLLGLLATAGLLLYGWKGTGSVNIRPTHGTLPKQMAAKFLHSG